MKSSENQIYKEIMVCTLIAGIRISVFCLLLVSKIAFAESGISYKIPDADDNDFYYGIDIYAMYDGIDIDFEAVKRNGYKFVFFKVSEGKTSPDVELEYKLEHKELWQAQRDLAQNAKKAELKIGYYHFAHPGNNSAVDEARNFMSSLESGYPQKDFPLVLDFEARDIQKLANRPEILRKWVSDFVEAMGLKKNEMILYGNAGSINLLKLNLSNSEQSLGEMPLWVAAYIYPQSAKVDKRHMPQGWNEYQIFQYTEMGFVDGVDADSDNFKNRMPEFYNCQTTLLEEFYSNDADLKKFICKDKNGKQIEGRECKPAGPYVDLNVMRKDFFVRYQGAAREE